MKLIGATLVFITLIWILPTTTSAFVMNESLGLTKTDAMILQSCLKRMGFNPGAIDGLWGVSSQTAFKQWLITRGYLYGGTDGEIRQQFESDCKQSFASHRQVDQPQTQTSQLQIGMRREQVISILGEPSRKVANQTTEHWVYRGSEKIYMFKFEYGKLTDVIYGTQGEWQKALSRGEDKSLY